MNKNKIVNILKLLKMYDFKNCVELKVKINFPLRNKRENVLDETQNLQKVSVRGIIARSFCKTVRLQNNFFGESVL